MPGMLKIIPSNIPTTICNRKFHRIVLEINIFFIQYCFIVMPHYKIRSHVIVLYGAPLGLIVVDWTSISRILGSQNVLPGW